MAVKHLFSMYALGTNVAQNKIFVVFFFFLFPSVVLSLLVNPECLFLLQQRCNMLFCMRAPELL